VPAITFAAHRVDPCNGGSLSRRPPKEHASRCSLQLHFVSTTAHAVSPARCRSLFQSTLFRTVLSPLLSLLSPCTSRRQKTPSRGRSGSRMPSSRPYCIRALPLTFSKLATPQCVAHDHSVSKAGMRGLTWTSSLQTFISAFGRRLRQQLPLPPSSF
jgi:hypothetical protein